MMDPSLLKDSKVLVIDDSSANLEIISLFLGEAGYQVLLKKDGLGGIELAKREKPHVILLDIIMPGIDGYEVCQRLKAKEETREIPVIFMSALTDTEEKIRCFEVGGEDYISKPLQMEEVMARVKIHLSLVRAVEKLRAQDQQIKEMAEELERLRGEKEL